MSLPHTVTVVCLLFAVAFTMAAESRPKQSSWYPWVALVLLYGVCVGTIWLLLGYFFSVGNPAAVAIAVPLGLPALFIAARMSEN